MTESLGFITANHDADMGDVLNENDEIKVCEEQRLLWCQCGWCLKDKRVDGRKHWWTIEIMAAEWNFETDVWWTFLPWWMSNFDLPDADADSDSDLWQI